MENVKANAWSQLIQLEVKTLPIDMLAIANDLGYNVIPYNEANDILELFHLTNYASTHTGFTFQIDDKPNIFYDDSLPYSDRNCVIAHELGHIKSGHTRKNGIYGKSSNIENESEQEKEADIFAYAFLAPVPVLLEMGLETASEISRLTGLPTSKTRTIVNEIFNEKSVKNTGLEIKLIQQFQPYIESYRIQEIPKKQYSGALTKVFMQHGISRFKKNKNLIFMLIALICCSTTFIFSIILINNKPDPNVGPFIISSGNSYSVQQTISTTQVEAKSTKERTQVQFNTDPNVPSAMPEPSVAKVEEPKQINAETIVAVTKTGKKYHLPNCQYTSNKTGIRTLTIQEAIDAGLNPCKICKPNK